MKLNELKTNVDLATKGDWVDNIPGLPGLRIRARPVSNPLYRRRQSELIRALPLSKRGDQIEMEKIDTTLIVETVLLEWDGLDDAPYSKDTAARLISDPEYQSLRDGVMFAAAIVGERASASNEADAKN